MLHSFCGLLLFGVDFVFVHINESFMKINVPHEKIQKIYEPNQKK